MTAAARRGAGPARAVVVGTVIALVVVGAVMLVAPAARSDPQRPAATAAGAPSQQVSSSLPSLSGPMALPARPDLAATTVSIPAIGVRSSLETLHLDAQHVLQPPHDYQRAGWYGAGPVPGEPGPAVIAGHVDSTSGPAVFAGLGQLRRGDVVLVGRSDGRTVRFVVASVVAYPKDSFPTAAVYGPTPVATLRLITCGGVYDHARHRYTDDVVVYAEEA